MSDYFSLCIDIGRSKTIIIMKMFTNILNTWEIPQTVPILQELLPNILRSTCFNDENLPFYEEVRRTEIGHLFEHILLEYICKLKVADGCGLVEYSGETEWDWYKYSKGTFHITINAGGEIQDIFPKALYKSCNLLDIILESSFMNNHIYEVYFKRLNFKTYNF